MNEPRRDVLAEAIERARIDEEKFRESRRILAELKAQRNVNHWAERVSAAFRETR